MQHFCALRENKTLLPQREATWLSDNTAPHTLCCYRAGPVAILSDGPPGMQRLDATRKLPISALNAAFVLVVIRTGTAAAHQSKAQNASLKAICNCRFATAVPPITPAVEVPMVAPGKANCG
jgi:hypothetical protein